MDTSSDLCLFFNETRSGFTTTQHSKARVALQPLCTYLITHTHTHTNTHTHTHTNKHTHTHTHTHTQLHINTHVSTHTTQHHQNLKQSSLNHQLTTEIFPIDLCAA